MEDVTADSRIKEYFARNGIVRKRLSEASAEHRSIGAIEDNAEYYRMHFKTGLDDFLDGVNIESNERLFNALLNEARKYQDVFEPCCQSGLLGVYLAGNIPGKYKGMDVSKEAVDKAKARATRNGLDVSLFELGDVMQYDGKHEVIIGRNVINDGEYSINETMLRKIAEIGKRFVLIEGVDASIPIELTPSIYEDACEKQGISFRVVHPPIATSTNSSMFVLEGRK